MTPIRQVLDVARWAPSGDNTQPWRFEIRSETSALIHGHDTRDHCVYDLDGWASQISHGALIENVALAATRFRHRATLEIVDENDGGCIVYSVDLEPAGNVAPHALAPFIEQRTVQRRSMKTTPLTLEQRDALAASVDGFALMFKSLPSDRWRMASLNARNARIRLISPEAYEVHKAVIAWNCQTSEDRLPDASLGANALLLATMRFAMASWERVDFFNRYAAGTAMPRLLLDLLPGVLCSSHFALIAHDEARTTRERVEAGRAVQRLWLTATALGLQMQPSYTPLVFARYARAGRTFTRSSAATREARTVARRLEELLGAENAMKAVFLGRFGPARDTPARSLRLPLERLLVAPALPSAN
jgi:nitroreductase